MTIIIILLSTYLANLLNIQPVYATGHGDDKQNLADVFVFGSGIFAAFLFALSLLAYRYLLTKRLLLVSAAFGIFANMRSFQNSIFLRLYILSRRSWS